MINSKTTKLLPLSRLQLCATETNRRTHVGVYRFGAVSDARRRRSRSRTETTEKTQSGKEQTRRQRERTERGGWRWVVVAGVVCVQKGEELPSYCAHTQRVWEKIPARCRRQFRDSVRPLLQQYIRAKQHNEQDADPLVQREQLILRLLDIPSIILLRARNNSRIAAQQLRQQIAEYQLSKSTAHTKVKKNPFLSILSTHLTHHSPAPISEHTQSLERAPQSPFPPAHSPTPPFTRTPRIAPSLCTHTPAHTPRTPSIHTCLIAHSLSPRRLSLSPLPPLSPPPLPPPPRAHLFLSPPILLLYLNLLDLSLPPFLSQTLLSPLAPPPRALRLCLVHRLLIVVL